MMYAPSRMLDFPGAHDLENGAAGDPMLAMAVDTLKQGLLLFDAGGHVLSANAAARRAIQVRPEIELVTSPEPPHDRILLRLRRTALQLKLERALRACAAGQGAPVASPQIGTPRGPRAPQALILTFEQGQPGLILQLSPMPPASQGRLIGSEPAVLGVLIDRMHVPKLDPTMLRELFGLTEAESRVTEAYLRADTVKEVASILGVSVNTVKTHLAAAYLKTGCTRQAQLVRLLMSLSDLSDDCAAR
jgi:DNA-binding CsgD family transcriptional regulator